MLPDNDIEQVAQLNQAFERITSELGKVIVGQRSVIEELLIAMFARGHCLLVGVPGLAKTLMIRTLADALSLKFRFLPGPIFGNVILADEINRTPPKTQAALLEAMQEHQVTVGGTRRALTQPFFVLATQNPIEQEGTYPLPEAQLDRFMFNIFVDYPDEDEEFRIVKQTTTEVVQSVAPTLDAEQIIQLGQIVRKVPVADHVLRYALRLTRTTRRDNALAPDFVREYVSWGAGPRASQFLVLGAKARAVLHGRYHATADDVRAVALPVLRHRIMTNFNAEAEGIKPEAIIRRLLETIPLEDENEARARQPQIFRSADAG